MKFRKKPVVVDAIQWTGENDFEMSSFLFTDWHKYVNDCLVIKTREGEMTASVGDWIIKGVAGEFYPCKPDIFWETYEVYTLPGE